MLRNWGAVWAILAGCSLAGFTACSSGGGHDPPPDGGGPLAELEPGEIESVGSATSYVFDARAFVQPAFGLAGTARTLYLSGQTIFEIDWTPSGLADRQGLGPTYNSTSCQACHFANGRGAPPLASGAELATALLRVSVAGQDEHGGPAPHPLYGDQIQPRAIADVPPEGTVRVEYVDVPGHYGDGTPYVLSRPRIVLAAALGEPGAVQTSMRVAARTIGMGFLAAIPEETITARADPDDRDGDGISGRVNRVWDRGSVRGGRESDGTNGSLAIGRFGWKANQPTVLQQNAAAFLGDLGITSPVFPEQNCPAGQTKCKDRPSPTEPELSAPRLEAVTAFMRGTSVPARRDADDPRVLRGKWLFRSMGCASCHVPSMTTGAVPDFPVLSGQKIWPYTDLLLHDMGDDLADGRPDFLADGREWRTPPLWGLGLEERVSGHERLLHDGRARGVAEAILWHGGEARASADAFRHLGAADRSAIVNFLLSL